MDELPFYKKPIFFVVLWVIVLIGLYAYQVFSQSSLNIVVAVIINAIFLIILFRFWMAFYAQFMLPVRTNQDRSKILQRLNQYLSNSHGPAIFIKDGRVIAKEGELNRKSAGVIWLDSASAAVTRTPSAYRQVMGVGVHFTEHGEYLAGWLDLHTQVQSIGPNESDLPFETLPENATEEHRVRHREVIARRTAVSGLTRDGIEIVPNINVVFRLDAKPAPVGWPGSRFGYDENAVFKAISKEGINPGASEEARRVAWNQLPALIAADLWREYLTKFTLNQLFEPTQPVAPDLPQPEPQDLVEGLRPLPRPNPGLLARTLRYINRDLDQRLEKIESEKSQRFNAAGASSFTKKEPPASSETGLKTALQVIIQMMKARMTQPLVSKLDETGRLLEDHGFSEEYKKLQERGLKIVSVSVSSLRLPPAIEERSIREWNANWLVNARAESERITREIEFVSEDAQRSALLEYTAELSGSLAKSTAIHFESILRVLLEKSRTVIMKDDGVRQVLNVEPPRKDQPDIAKAILSLLANPSKESPPAGPAAPEADGNLGTIDQIIERSGTKDQ